MIQKTKKTFQEKIKGNEKLYNVVIFGQGLYLLLIIIDRIYFVIQNGANNALSFVPMIALLVQGGVLLKLIKKRHFVINWVAALHGLSLVLSLNMVNRMLEVGLNNVRVDLLISSFSAWAINIFMVVLCLVLLRRVKKHNENNH